MSIVVSRTSFVFAALRLQVFFGQYITVNIISPSDTLSRGSTRHSPDLSHPKKYRHMHQLLLCVFLPQKLFLQGTEAKHGSTITHIKKAWEEFI